MSRQSMKSLLISLMVVAAVAFGSSLTIPNQFSAGTPTSASQMNANFTAVASAVNDNNSRITALETTPAWTAPPSLGAEWANWGGANFDAGYYKDRSGTVHLRGLLKRTSGAAAIFELPPGYQPTKQSWHAVAHTAGQGWWVVVFPNGKVQINNFNGDFSGPVNLIALDGITFDTR